MQQEHTTRLNGQFFWFSLLEARENTQAILAYAIHMQPSFQDFVFGFILSDFFCADLSDLSDLRRGTRQESYHATGPCELPHFPTLSGFGFQSHFQFHFVQPICA